MIIDLDSEDDLWRLFGGEDHTKPGNWQQSFAGIERHLLDTNGFHKHRAETPSRHEVAKARKKIKQRFPLNDTARLYLLTAADQEVVVDQSRLLRIGRTMKRSSGAVAVQYLGAVSGSDSA
jgi:hypothetical protein